ncbi:tetratricopeptide repeat protein [Litorivivens sp.]|uniref:tetratricopeptide repeat protein n=1 Tax=Litorivivens sp. TaxID=2020868 RepID=UPI0035656920
MKISRLIVGAGLLALSLMSAAREAAPPVEIPESDTIIWRNTLHQDPTTITATLNDVRKLIQWSQTHGDLRALGRADALLLQSGNTNVESRILRAIINQRQHRFAEAAAVLRGVLAESPDHAQANFTLYSIALVQGDFALARTTCQRLQTLGFALIAQSCLHNLLGLEGEAEQAFLGLDAVVQSPPPHTPQERAWAAGTLAELAAAIDHPHTERYYRQALQLAPDDHYSAAGLAQWYLQHNQAEAALAALADRPRTDRLDLLRLIAMRKIPNIRSDSLYRQLKQRFESASQRDASLHLHERARFELDVEQRPEEALKLAEANYRQQKERADFQLLQRARQQAGMQQ